MSWASLVWTLRATLRACGAPAQGGLSWSGRCLTLPLLRTPRALLQGLGPAFLLLTSLSGELGGQGSSPPLPPLPWAEALCFSCRLADWVCPHCRLPGLLQWPLSSGVRRLSPEGSRVRSPALGHSTAASLLLGAPAWNPRRWEAGAGPARPICPVGSCSRHFRKPHVCSFHKRRLRPVTLPPWWRWEHVPA